MDSVDTYTGMSFPSWEQELNIHTADDNDCDEQQNDVNKVADKVAG